MAGGSATQELAEPASKEKYMANYESLTLAIALIAVLISLVSMRRASKTHSELLAQKQLEQIEHEERGKLAFSAERNGARLRFAVENVGNFDAESISLDLIPKDHLKSPLSTSDYADKFPVELLGPGSSITVNASISLETATAFRVVLKWQDPGGRERRQETDSSL